MSIYLALVPDGVKQTDRNSNQNYIAYGISPKYRNPSNRLLNPIISGFVK